MESIDPGSPTAPRRRRLALFAWLAIAAAIVAGGAVWWHKSQPYHFLVVEEGKLYRSGRLEPEVLTEVIEKYGIKTVVNLKGEAENRQPWHAAEQKATADAGALHVDIVMAPDTPPTPAQLDTWLALFEDPDRQPVIVHCQHGVIRTGMMVGVFEMEQQGKTNQQIEEDMPSFGHEMYIPQRDRMWTFLRGYRPRTEKSN